MLSHELMNHKNQQYYHERKTRPNVFQLYLKDLYYKLLKLVLSLHLNHLIASHVTNYDWPFGTLLLDFLA